MTMFNAVRHMLPRRFAASLQTCANPGCECVGGIPGLLSKRLSPVLLNGRWFCSANCSRQFLSDLAEAAVHSRRSRRDHPHRIPLGLLLLSRGTICSAHLQSALTLQHTNPGMFLGECLQHVGAVSEREIALAIAAQWARPLFSSPLGFLGTKRTIPFEWQTTYRMVPVHWIESARRLHVGFLDEVDYLALAAIEAILECTTAPCIVGASTFKAAMAGGQQSRSDDLLEFAPGLTTDEITNVVLNYVEQTGITTVRFASTPESVWVRLCAQDPMDLLFRIQYQRLRAVGARSTMETN